MEGIVSWSARGGVPDRGGRGMGRRRPGRARSWWRCQAGTSLVELIDQPSASIGVEPVGVALLAVRAGDDLRGAPAEPHGAAAQSEDPRATPARSRPLPGRRASALSVIGLCAIGSLGLVVASVGVLADGVIRDSGCCSASAFMVALAVWSICDILPRRWLSAVGRRRSRISGRSSVVGPSGPLRSETSQLLDYGGGRSRRSPCVITPAYAGGAVRSRKREPLGAAACAQNRRR